MSLTTTLSGYALGALLITIAGAAGALFTSRVEDEMQALERPIRVLQAILGLALLLVLPWWLALVIAGALALGWLPMAGALGLLAALGGIGVIALALPLALLAGARSTLDRQPILPFVVALLAFTFLFAALHAIGALAFLG